MPLMGGLQISGWALNILKKKEKKKEHVIELEVNSNNALYACQNIPDATH